MPASLNQPFGVYVHWPYCLSKCPYCDFYSLPDSSVNEKELLHFYKRDILFFRKKKKKFLPVTSVFFGGGTSSLMSSGLLAEILMLLKTHFEFAPSVEITIEANPDAIDAKKMERFADLGVNRLSLGVQALSESALRFLGRRHTVKTALKQLKTAGRIFPCVNADFIYARPGQTVKMWLEELKNIVSLSLLHYSLYQLGIEKNTPFYRRQIQLPDEETARGLYLATNAFMAEAGYPAYEVSNYAAKGYECLHNLTYWRNGNYLGIGPAAHGRIDFLATENPRSVQKWMQQNPVCVNLTPEEKTAERVLMGLRLLKEGFPVSLLDLKGVESAIRFGWGTVRKNLFYPSAEGAVVLNQLILTVLPK